MSSSDFKVLIAAAGKAVKYLESCGFARVDVCYDTSTEPATATVKGAMYHHVCLVYEVHEGDVVLAGLSASSITARRAGGRGNNFVEIPRQKPVALAGTITQLEIIDSDHRVLC